MPFCTECGSGYSGDARFCGSCGAPLTVVHQSSVPDSGSQLITSAEVAQRLRKPLYPETFESAKRCINCGSRKGREQICTTCSYGQAD
jgi:Double zinc ribbon